MYDEWNGNNYVHIEVSELHIIQDEIENIKEILSKLEESTVSESNEMTTFQINKSESLVILDIWERFLKKNYFKIYGKDSDKISIYTPVFKQYYYKLLDMYSKWDTLQPLSIEFRRILISIFTIGKILDMDMMEK
jgi:hypothetical protein